VTLLGIAWTVLVILGVFWILPIAVRMGAKVWFQEREKHIKRVMDLAEGEHKNGKV
jgi:phage gp46-like protein